MKFLPTKVHGILDYLVGIALLMAPMIFGFNDVGGAAVFIPRLLGAVLIIYSVFTNYEWGLIKIIGMPYHLMVDFAASAFLVASPFLFGFHNEKKAAWVPHIVVGLVVILVVLVTQTQPGTKANAQHKVVA